MMLMMMVGRIDRCVVVSSVSVSVSRLVGCVDMKVGVIIEISM